MNDRSFTGHKTAASYCFESLFATAALYHYGRARFFEWAFRIGGKDVAIDVRGRLVLDEMRATLGATSHGGGLALVFRQSVAAEIASGAGRNCSNIGTTPDELFHLYYANCAHTPGKLRDFIDFMQASNSKR